ncbi:MAG: hypothetical protein ACI9IP_002607 [Arcticibacterium sp.]|jgi:hypothetical protein
MNRMGHHHLDTLNLKNRVIIKTNNLPYHSETKRHRFQSPEDILIGFVTNLKP